MKRAEYLAQIECSLGKACELCPRAFAAGYRIALSEASALAAAHGEGAGCDLSDDLKALADDEFDTEQSAPGGGE